jgi:hypothetical protein
LNPVGIIGVDDRPRSRLRDERGILQNLIEGFHLESTPVGPDRGGDAVGREQVGDLVCLDTVVE